MTRPGEQLEGKVLPGTDVLRKRPNQGVLRVLPVLFDPCFPTVFQVKVFADVMPVIGQHVPDVILDRLPSTRCIVYVARDV